MVWVMDMVEKPPDYIYNYVLCNEIPPWVNVCNLRSDFDPNQAIPDGRDWNLPIQDKRD